MRAHIFRVVAAFVGAVAFVVAALFVATDTQAQAKTAIPEHFGGPVYKQYLQPHSDTRHAHAGEFGCRYADAVERAELSRYGGVKLRVDSDARLSSARPATDL